jgi:hypothetical protein
MKPNKRLLKAWENAIALGNAWLVFAYAKNRKRYHELQREGEHHGLQSHMERELIWRICDGEFQAFGIEHGSDAGPIPIPKYYFSKTVVVDWDRETVEAFGKKFHEVRVQGEREREPADEARLSGPLTIIDPYEITAQRERERLRETPPDEPEPSHEPPIQAELETTSETPPSEPAPSHKPRMGRPPLIPWVREVVRELIDRNEFADLTKAEIDRLVLGKARERFSALFPKPNRPSKNTISKALSLDEVGFFLGRAPAIGDALTLVGGRV